MLNSLTRNKSASSSSRWLARNKRDPFRIASNSNNNNYVARSAHKLLELDAAMPKGTKLLRPGCTILELGAAPGGWTQVCIEKLQGKGVIVAVDLLQLDDSVAEAGRKSGIDFHAIEGDMRDSKTLQAIDATFKGQVDVVLSDMLANTSGNSLRDAQASLDLCQLVYSLADRYKSSMLVMKILQSQEAAQWRKEILETAYDKVKWAKPDSSRKESREGYLVCSGRKQAMANATATTVLDDQK